MIGRGSNNITSSSNIEIVPKSTRRRIRSLRSLLTITINASIKTMLHNINSSRDKLTTKINNSTTSQPWFRLPPTSFTPRAIIRRATISILSLPASSLINISLHLLFSRQTQLHSTQTLLANNPNPSTPSGSKTTSD